MRYNYDRIDVASNATEIIQVASANIMIYPNGLLMAKIVKDTKNPRASNLTYTKHYYIGSERISAKIGTSINLGLYSETLFATAMPQISHPVVRNPSNQSVQDAGAIVAMVYSKFNQSPPANNPMPDGNSLGIVHDLGKINYFYFHPDHLGSSSYITNKAGIVSQHMEYLPFGETLVDEHLNSYNSPFKYNGKEFDAETGNYYYGARYYDPKWSIFISVDPLAEKTPDWTPYRYGFNNPARYTDPTGMFEDDYEINSKGIIIRKIENKESDNFYMVDDDGERIEGKSISFKPNTILKHNSQKSTYNKRNDDGTTESAITDLDIYKIRGDDNGTQLFEFFADNTTVEFGHAKIGQKGDKGLNFITTGHIAYTEPGIADLVEQELYKGYNFREFNHNHPANTQHPSNTDIQQALNITDWYKMTYPDRKAPLFHIYIPAGKNYIPFTKSSQRSDFK